MASLVDIIAEDLRQARTGDDQFLVKAPYMFVLQGPAFNGPIGFTGSAEFPLPVNPQEFTYTMPFAAEITPLQQGGVVSEEGGIVIGEISIDASLGFAPKPDRNTARGPGDGDFSGLLGTSGLPSEDKISAQMHFWRLANRCFDAYSALKKDPETAAQTTLEFHSIRDQLHLTVVPREFALRRNAAKERVSYRFTARLAVVGPAQKQVVVSPDKNIIAKIKDTISTIRSAVQTIAATVDDLTAALDEIRRTIGSAAAILSDFLAVSASFEALIDGSKRFLDIPRQALAQLGDDCEAAASIADTVADWPADISQSFRVLGDMSDALIVAATNYYGESWNRQIERYHELINKGPLSVGARDYGVQSTPGQGDTSHTAASVFGGGEKPGDARRESNLIAEGRVSALEYQGISERVVGHGDTIQSLAAKHLGNARRWLDLAIINDLRAPYITDQAHVPNTLRIGDKIVVPARAPKGSPDTITTGAPGTGESQAAKNLGRDFLMIPVDGNLLGWQIDKAGGSVDVLQVEGIDNFAQAIEMRFRTEQGHNILYPAIGLPRAVGTSPNRQETIDLRYQARAQMLADKRVERVASLDFTLEDDRLVLEADLQPVGFSSLRNVSRKLT
jgi:hypothetical protein